MLRHAAIYLFAMTLLAGFVPGRAETLSPYHVKAACLYNFLKFVEWPSEVLPKDRPYVIGVLGTDPFGAILDTTMNGKSVNGRSIVVVRVTEAEIQRPHLLFVSTSERKRYRQILTRLQSTPVLTVGESDEFAETGGCVEFFLENNKVRFQINPEAAKQSGLKIHSTLLNLSRIVRTR